MTSAAAMTPALLRERASAMRASAASAQAPPKAPSVGIKLVGTEEAIARRDRKLVRAAVSYGKYLRSMRNQKGASAIFLDTAGKAFYEQHLEQIRRRDRASGVVRIVYADHDEVMRGLERMSGGGVVMLHHPTVQKFMSGDLRMVRGLASTAEVDRQGDIVVPSGMKVKLPVPLLWAHDHKQPIGSVRSAEIRADGIWIEASIVTGTQRADEAWTLIDAGAIDSFSIGFGGLKSDPIETGRRYVLWELYEVSVVAVGANASAKIRRSL